MGRVAIISVDGHVKAPRAAYREYVDPDWRDAFDAWLQSVEDAGDGFVGAALEYRWFPARSSRWAR